MSESGFNNLDYKKLGKSGTPAASRSIEVGIGGWKMF